MIAYSESLNHGQFETWTEKPQLPLVHVTQVHGTEIASLPSLPCEADGLVLSWDQFDKPLAIKTADCMPIVIEGQKGVVFLHAGWRGLADGILKRAEIASILPQQAFIGPSIHQCCFEVSSDFTNHFPQSEFFTQRDDKHYFDLTKEARKQLQQVTPGLSVTIASACTCCQEQFHSYRRNKTTQRNWNLYIKG